MRTAPQQPAPSGLDHLDAQPVEHAGVAPLMLGYIDGCTQPARAITCRACVRRGRGPAE
jgi:hypothetical protein